MVASAVEKNLRLVFEATESARMDDSVAVTLILCAPFRRRLWKFPSARIAAELRERRERLAFDLFEFDARARHGLELICEQFLNGNAAQFKQAANRIFNQIV